MNLNRYFYCKDYNWLFKVIFNTIGKTEIGLRLLGLHILILKINENNEQAFIETKNAENLGVLNYNKVTLMTCNRYTYTNRYI